MYSVGSEVIYDAEGKEKPDADVGSPFASLIDGAKGKIQAEAEKGARKAIPDIEKRVKAIVLKGFIAGTAVSVFLFLLSRRG